VRNGSSYKKEEFKCRGIEALRMKSSSLFECGSLQTRLNSKEEEKKKRLRVKDGGL
jgi:hypothetical protein